MPSQAEFEEDGRVVWDEAAVRPTNLFRIQSAMFKDRPDLWPMRRRRAHRPIKPGAGQLPLLDYDSAVRQ